MVDRQLYRQRLRVDNCNLPVDHSASRDLRARRDLFTVQCKSSPLNAATEALSQKPRARPRDILHSSSFCGGRGQPRGQVSVEVSVRPGRRGGPRRGQLAREGQEDSAPGLRPSRAGTSLQTTFGGSPGGDTSQGHKDFQIGPLDVNQYNSRQLYDSSAIIHLDKSQIRTRRHCDVCSVLYSSPFLILKSLLWPSDILRSLGSLSP